MHAGNGRWQIVLALIALLAAAGESRAQTPLKWGSDAEGGAPYLYKDPQNPDKNIGFEVDLAAALAETMQRPIELKHNQFDQLIEGVQRGDIDFAMNGLEITPDRLNAVRFSRPYYIYKLQLVVRTDDDRFQSFEDCVQANAKTPLKIGTLSNTAAYRLLTKSGFTPTTYDNQAEPYTDLSLGRIDGVLMDAPIATVYAKPKPKQFRYAGPAFAPGYYAIAVGKTNEELAQQLDAALEKLLANGKLRQIYEKWELWNEDQDRLNVAKVSDVTAESGENWTPRVYVPYLIDGALMTVKLSFMSMALAIVLGMVVAVARLYGPAPLRWLAVGYVEFFRGIPVLLLLIFLYYGLPEVAGSWGLGKWFQIGPIQAAVLAFGLNYAAFEAEIYRSGIASIPAGQWEAASSLGMSSSQTFWRIIMPQAIRTILPPSTNDFVALFKDTSVVSVVSVIELTKQYQILSKSSLKYFEIGIATALLYLIMSVPLGLLSRWLERYWNRELHQ